ncbi:HDOD domain-containing protein [Undibacterium sp. Ji67W]|uniref:HDOD domain-containing protein n=1 Tax=Undibacterium sp. Ji67W TaxID=3413042 RepID=UPI003BF0E13B
MKKSEALKKIVEQARSGDLTFPANIQATLEIQEALNCPDCGIETAAKLVTKEPMIAVRVVAIANSVAYSRFGGGVTNVRTAITILGFNTLRSVVVAVAMRQMSQATKNPQIRAMIEKLWLHSAHVAALAHLIARKISKIDPETALFAGVVHEVSSFYLLSRAEEFPELLDPHQSHKDDVLDEDHEIFIGRSVLHQLLVPKRVVSAIETLWYGARATPPETLGETLLLANDLASCSSPLEHRDVAMVEKTALEIDFPFKETSLRQILAESDDDLQSLIASLID